MNIMKNKFLLFLLVPFLSVCGTAGTFMDNLRGEPVIPLAANRIYLFPIRSGKEGFAAGLRHKLEAMLISDSRLAVVPALEEGDIAFACSVTGFYSQVLSYAKFAQADKKRLMIETSASMRDLNKNKAIFSEGNVKAFFEYSSLTPPVVSDLQAEEALTDILAKRLFEKIISGWYTNQMSDMEKGKSNGL